MGKGGRDEDSCNSVINKNKVKKNTHRRVQGGNSNHIAMVTLLNLRIANYAETLFSVI